jgi:hypothetical protein
MNKLSEAILAVLDTARPIEEAEEVWRLYLASLRENRMSDDEKPWWKQLFPNRMAPLPVPPPRPMVVTALSDLLRGLREDGYQPAALIWCNCLDAFKYMERVLYENYANEMFPGPRSGMRYMGVELLQASYQPGQGRDGRFLAFVNRLPGAQWSRINGIVGEYSNDVLGAAEFLVKRREPAAATGETTRLVPRCRCGEPLPRDPQARFCYECGAEIYLRGDQ